MSESLLTVAEVRERLGYKTRGGFWHFLRRNPDFPEAVMIGGNTLRYVASEVEDWMVKAAGRRASRG